MADRDPVARSWPELAAGALLGLFAAQRLGLDGTTALFIAGLGAFAAYLIGCALFPRRFCWWCKGKNFWSDGRGNLAEKPCWRCHRKRILVRPGARLLGRGGD